MVRCIPIPLQIVQEGKSKREVERAYMGVVLISIPLSFVLVSLSSPRISSILKQPKQVYFKRYICILTPLPPLLFFLIYFFHCQILLVTTEIKRILDQFPDQFPDQFT